MSKFIVGSYLSVKRQFEEAGLLARLFFIASVLMIIATALGVIYLVGGAMYLGFFYPEL